MEEPLKVVRHVVDRLGLALNESKTHVVDAKETGFNFLGFTLQMSRGTKTGKWYPNVRPSDKAVGKIMAKVTDLTPMEANPPHQVSNLPRASHAVARDGGE